MDVVRSCKNKLQTLRALAGSGWGCQKEVLLRAYKTYVEPCINYAAPIWAPNVSASSISLIQRIQNRALRIATGCHMASSLSHIHQEAKFAFASDHLSMLCSQFLASSLCPSHPSNTVVTAPPGPRPMKHTLKSRYFSSVEPLLVNGSVDTANHRATLNQIHTQAVNNSISKLAPNPLLGATPPPISPSESRLPRNQRTTLAQLRSGHCRLLGDYKVLTGLGTSALCLECLFRRQTVPHLFNCDAAQTQLTVRDLWINPVTAMVFLVSLSSFSMLASSDPPRPPPPPEPPP